MSGCRHLTLTGSALMAALIILTTAGCASPSTPSLSELASARSAIERAEQAGANAAAPARLNAARDRLAEAEQLLPNDEPLARWRAKEAESDARLAEAAARRSRTQSSS